MSSGAVDMKAFALFLERTKMMMVMVMTIVVTVAVLSMI
jgi:hypothetical protein